MLPVLLFALVGTGLVAGGKDALPKEDLPLSFGAGSCGRLKGGVALPCAGHNFKAFSPLACVARRNYLHPLVARTVVDAYALLRDKHPGRTWQYGEMGWPHGGRFWPHRTHRAGVSADFMVPVVRHGKPATLPSHPFNQFGYGIEFSAQGVAGSQHVDWVALADHLHALRQAGKHHGVSIKLVILDHLFRPHLFKADPAVRALPFNKGKPWIRHDEHYHVDFTLPAPYHRPLRCGH